MPTHFDHNKIQATIHKNNIVYFLFLRTNLFSNTSQYFSTCFAYDKLGLLMETLLDVEEISLSSCSRDLSLNKNTGKVQWCF